MDYTDAILGLLVLLLLVELAIILWRLGPSGSRKLMALAFLNRGYRKTNASIDRRSDKTILVVGDSIAVGPGAAENETVANRLAESLGTNTISLARNGARTREVINQFESVRDKKFYMVIVHAGNNDIWKLTRLGRLKNDIKVLLDEAAKFSDKVVLFRGGNIGNCPFFPFPISTYYTYRSRKVRDMFMEEADKRGILYAEKWMEREDDIFLKEPKKFYSWDMLHLNGNGFEVWYEYLLEQMKQKG